MATVVRAFLLCVVLTAAACGSARADDGRPGGRKILTFGFGLSNLGLLPSRGVVNSGYDQNPTTYKPGNFQNPSNAYQPSSNGQGGTAMSFAIPGLVFAKGSTGSQGGTATTSVSGGANPIATANVGVIGGGGQQVPPPMRPRVPSSHRGPPTVGGPPQNRVWGQSARGVQDQPRAGGQNQPRLGAKGQPGMGLEGSEPQAMNGNQGLPIGNQGAPNLQSLLGNTGRRLQAVA